MSLPSAFLSLSGKYEVMKNREEGTAPLQADEAPSRGGETAAGGRGHEVRRQDLVSA